MPAHLKISANPKGTRDRAGSSRLLVAVGLALLAGCSGAGTEAEPVAEISQALNACDETVPDNRFVDGFPAYAQCGSTTSSAIWSNNGVDTATTSQGTGWVRTQRSGGYQCTEWAWRYMHFKWGVDYQNGNAGSWCDGNLPATLTKATTPVHGDLIVFAPGVCGSDGTTGHIAVIDTVNTSAGTVTFVEENNAGRRSAKQTCATCFLHAVANDGSTGAGVGGGSGSGGATNTGGSATSTGGRASGGRAGSSGASASGMGGSMPMSTGGSVTATAGSTGTAGSVNSATGGTLASTGGTTGGTGTQVSAGGVASGGVLSSAGTASAGSPGKPASGGVPSSVETGGAPATTGGGPAQPGAGGPGTPITPISDVESGCSLSGGAPTGAAGRKLDAFALALAGLALRLRAKRRRA